MLILHGSATGTATDVAATLFRLARRYKVPDLQLFSLQDISLVQLVETTDLAVFVVSTTGNGDIPASMHGFWSTLLRSDVDAHLLEDLNFVIVGLGDSKYVQFNWTAKKLRRRLLQLGGHEVLEVTMCDESANEGQDTALLPFVKSFESLLRELNGNHEPIAKEVILPPVCPVSLVNNNHSSCEAPTIHNKYGKLVAHVKTNSRLTTKAHFQDVRLLSFIISTDASDSIEPGDVLSLYPANSDESVDRFIELLGWQDQQDKLITLPPNAKALDFFLDTDITLRRFIKAAIPINGIPSLNLFSQLVQFTQDENFKEKFDEWEQPDGKDDLYDYLTRARRTLLEVIEDFAHGIKVPVEHCVDLFGLIFPRSYSIAGARAMTFKPGTTKRLHEVELLVAMVKYQTRIKEPRQGLASRYLSSLGLGTSESSQNTSLLVRIEKPLMEANKMPVPPLSIPLLLICTGTGFAPLRFFITRLQRSGEAVMKKHEITLLFGCRSRDDDLVASTLSDSLRDTIETIHAYSRLSTPRTYVQDLIPLHTDKIRSIVARGGRVYLCGSSGAMPDAVCAAMDTAIGPELSVQQLLDQGRWWQETW